MQYFDIYSWVSFEAILCDISSDLTYPHKCAECSFQNEPSLQALKLQNIYCIM